MTDDDPVYIYTCDAGGCDSVTVAIMLTDGGWLPMCAKHARRELDKAELTGLYARRGPV